ncbi:MAG: LysM peptidoglycan-binding domain-containing protein [Deltaproteobacteria bacterium]|nr:LysM peptidoglycan-binding domain-containing protein [Deltaproteobacteria bacterium]
MIKRFIIGGFLIFLWLVMPVHAKEITLVKHASRVQNLDHVGYTVKEGDTLWKIFMDVFDAGSQDLPYLYKRFRELNPHINDLNHIITGQKLVVPFTHKHLLKKGHEIKATSHDFYVIKKGQHLAMILREVYGLPDDLIFHKYLKLIKESNPDIEDLDWVYPGQKVKIPRPEGYAPTTAHKVVKPKKVLPTREKIPKHIDIEKVNIDKVIRNTMLPAFTEMGGKEKSEGMYFMPLPGGANVSINTFEVPVVELDTGRRIILDINGKISPEVKDLIEQTFSDCKVITAKGGDLEEIMDKVLSVSGYFSINKEGSPLLVGEEEKVRFSGKWIVYKDFSRRNVFVINILKEDEKKTPGLIKKYASRFGIDLIEIGGKDVDLQEIGGDYIKDLGHSYKALFDHLGIVYETDKEIKLITSDVVNIVYNAPIVVGNVILSDTTPNKSIIDFIEKSHMRFINTKKTSLKGVLDGVYVDAMGPPVKIMISGKRTGLELPGIRVGNNIILEKAIDADLCRYLAETGLDVFVW